MGAGFEAYDDELKLQFSSEAAVYYVHSVSSIPITNVSNSYGQVVVNLDNPSDLVAFRSATAYNMSGFRRATSYVIYTQALSGNIDVWVLRTFKSISPSADGYGLQQLNAAGELLYSAIREPVGVYGVASAYAADGLGDDPFGSLNTGVGSNPYALVLGQEFVGYTGYDEFDNFERQLCVSQTTSSQIVISPANRNDWPGMPGGTPNPGTYTVAAVY